MTFSQPTYLGNAYGPGKTVRTCTTCGVVVLDDISDQELHESWHATTDPDPSPVT